MSFIESILARRRLVVATALLMALAGVTSWLTMPREEDPEFPHRNGFVVTTFPGADAETVERLVVEPIEEHLAEVEEIRDVDSTARSGVAIVRMELQEHIYDTDSAWDEVRDAIEQARLDFPAGVSPPDLEDDTVSQEAIVLAVTGSPDPLVLTNTAEALKRRILSLPVVKQVEVVADPGEQITVEYDDATARRLGVDPWILGQQLANRSRILPGGVVHLGTKTASLRPQTEFTSLEEIRQTPILLPSGASVPLSELARVRQGPAEPATERMRWNGEPAVGLGIIPRDGIDRVKFGHAVRELLVDMRQDVAPLVIDEMVFQPDLVESRLSVLTGSLRLGILIVAGVLFVAMGVRLGILVAAVLPLVTFASIAIFASSGGILHQISIAALVIALGMLVDNAIVVAENIQWRLDKGVPVRQAAADSVRSLAFPLGTATGTTLAAFVPMLLAKGGTGDFTRSIPVLIMLTLTVSYVFAVLVTPVLAELALKRRQRQTSNVIEKVADRVGRFAVRRFPWVLAGAAVLLVVTLGVSGFVDQQFFPGADRNMVVIDLQMPEGTHLEHTNDVSRQLEEALMAHGEVASVGSFVGRAAPHFYYNLLSKPQSPHRAQLVVETVSFEGVQEIIEWTRTTVARDMPAVEAVAKRLEQGPPIAAPIEVRVLGHSLEAMESVADAVLGELRKIPETRDTRHNVGLGVPTVVFEIDDAAAGRHGLSRADVASALLGRTLGNPVGQYRMGDDPIPILVRSSAGEDFPVGDLEAIDVATPGGNPVPLAQLARIGVEWKPAAIHHRDREREMVVQAELAEGVTAHAILEQLEPRLAALDLPPGIRLEFGGELEESGRANDALFRAMPLGLLMLLFFLLAEFNSFRRVGIIMITVPLAATGVVPGLLLTGNPFGFMSMLGVISLVGIVVNNAIVLLDVVESLRDEGFPMDEALVEAVRRRMRPILLTMVTTVAGLSPLALSSTTLWPPLAWAMISGLIASTVLTLLVVPALYKLLFWGGEGHPLGRLFKDRSAAIPAAIILALLGGTLGATRAGADVPTDDGPLRMTLSEALERAAERPLAQAAEGRARAAEQLALAERRATRLPSLTVTADLMRRDRDFDFATPLGDFTLGERTSDAQMVAVSQPLLEPSARSYGVPAARSAAAALGFDAHRTRQELVAEAARHFFRVGIVDARRLATEAFIDSLRSRLEESEGLVAAGRILEADALKVRLDLEDAELDLLHLDAARDNAIRELAWAVGVEGTVEPVHVGIDREIPRPPFSELLAMAFESRPDIASMEQRIRELDLRARAVRAERLPTLRAQAVWSRSGGDPFRADELVEGTLGLVWTPFAAGTRAPRKAAFEAEQESLEADLLEVRRRIELSLHHRLAELDTAHSALEVRGRGVELAEETLRVERERYGAGRSTTNDLLAAEAALRNQRTARELARIEILNAWLELCLEVGNDAFLASMVALTAEE